MSSDKKVVVLLMKTVVAKEWLKNGLGTGVNYLDDVHILM